MGIRAIESMFIVGGIGSAIVLILTAIEDVETLLGMDESTHTDS